MKVAILGSGSSALGAALGILRLIESKSLEEPLNVHVIDYGEDANSFKALSGKEPKNPTHKSAGGSAVFAIPELFATESILYGGFAGSASFGGLANSWGATVQEYSEEYLKLFSPNGRSIREFFDYLETYVPVIWGSDHHIRDYRNLAKISAPSFGGGTKRNPEYSTKYTASSLAIKQFSSDQQIGCNQCGLCLRGCPSGNIWNPGMTWPTIFERLEFTYKKGEFVERIIESSSCATINLVNIQGVHSEESFDLVLVALGPLQTSALMIRSGFAKNSCVTVRDSQMIVIPFFMKNLEKTGSGDSTRISLSDAFFMSEEVNNPLEKNFFAQVYGWSNDLGNSIEKAFPILKIIPKALKGIFLERVGIAMCFLPMEQSGSIEASFDENYPGKVVFKAIPGPLSRAEMIRECGKHLKNLNFKFATLFSKVFPIGLGYHFGASFPTDSGDDSSLNSSDSEGRPNGARRIHIVDSSSLPKISSRPVTWTTMANACRIGFSSVSVFGGLGD